MNEPKNTLERTDYDVESAAERVEAAFRLVASWLAERPDYDVRRERVGEFLALKVTPAEPDRGVFVSTSHALRVLTAALGKREGFERVTYVVDVPPKREHGPRRQASGTWNAVTELSVVTLFDKFVESLFSRPTKIKWLKDEWKTTVTIELDEREPNHAPDVEVGDALSRVFGAIARARGRRLFVELSRRVAA